MLSIDVPQLLRRFGSGEKQVRLTFEKCLELRRRIAQRAMFGLESLTF